MDGLRYVGFKMNLKDKFVTHKKQPLAGLFF